jgi:hypothetical protein
MQAQREALDEAIAAIQGEYLTRVRNRWRKLALYDKVKFKVGIGDTIRSVLAVQPGLFGVSKIPL